MKSPTHPSSPDDTRWPYTYPNSPFWIRISPGLRFFWPFPPTPAPSDFFFFPPMPSSETLLDDDSAAAPPDADDGALPGDWTAPSPLRAAAASDSALALASASLFFLRANMILQKRRCWGAFSEEIRERKNGGNKEKGSRPPRRPPSCPRRKQPTVDEGSTSRTFYIDDHDIHRYAERVRNGQILLLKNRGFEFGEHYTYVEFIAIEKSSHFLTDDAFPFFFHGWGV